MGLGGLYDVNLDEARERHWNARQLLKKDKVAALDKRKAERDARALAEVWRTVVDSMPADHFIPANYHLLTQLCRHVRCVSPSNRTSIRADDYRDRLSAIAILGMKSGDTQTGVTTVLGLTLSRARQYWLYGFLQLLNIFLTSAFVENQIQVLVRPQIKPEVDVSCC
jgi:hypothetical protein